MGCRIGGGRLDEGSYSRAQPVHRGDGKREEAIMRLTTLLLAVVLMILAGGCSKSQDAGKPADGLSAEVTTTTAAPTVTTPIPSPTTAEPKPTTVLRPRIPCCPRRRLRPPVPELRAVARTSSPIVTRLGPLALRPSDEVILVICARWTLIKTASPVNNRWRDVSGLRRGEREVRRLGAEVGVPTFGQLWIGASVV
jgi:hypothetical protein